MWQVSTTVKQDAVSPFVIRKSNFSVSSRNIKRTVQSYYAIATMKESQKDNVHVVNEIFEGHNSMRKHKPAGQLPSDGIQQNVAQYCWADGPNAGIL